MGQYHCATCEIVKPRSYFDPLPEAPLDMRCPDCGGRASRAIEGL
jgi:DNA-directed RNA polymerase subunit RPC12/RpoP